MLRRLFYRAAKFFLGTISLWFVAEIKGLDNIPDKGPLVVVANHSSYIDPVIIMAIFEKYFNMIVFYLTKKEVYGNFLKKFLFMSAGTIPVDRQKHGKIALDAALIKLKEGSILGLFPEGTRSRDGKLHRGKTGAVRLALATKCPILPIGIKNSYEIWPRSKLLPKFRKGIEVNIGKPISLEVYYKKRMTKTMLRQITKKIMLKIGRLSGQEYVDVSGL